MRDVKIKIHHKSHRNLHQKLWDYEGTKFPCSSVVPICFCLNLILVCFEVNKKKQKKKGDKIGACVSIIGGAKRHGGYDLAPLPKHHRTRSHLRVGSTDEECINITFSGKLSSLSGNLGHHGGSTRIKGLFKNKPRLPNEIVRQTRDLIALSESEEEEEIINTRHSKRLGICAELSRNIRDLKSILYGNSEAEPVPEACLMLTQEFFREDTLRPLIKSIPKLDLETRKDATQIVANLQKQQVESRLVASEYLESNLDVIDSLVQGIDRDHELALHYTGMLKECVRHQVVAKYILESKNLEKFFDYVQLPYFDVATDASKIFRELLTRHKSTVAEYLAKNYEWFFSEYNTRLLERGSYFTKRQASKLLGDVLMDRSNSGVMIKYVSSLDNLRIMMNLLREPTKNIQLEAFHIFKLFVANENKPEDIVAILVANRNKILRLFADLKPEKEDEGFETDKALVMNEIATLSLLDIKTAD
ncbi:PREDICTED: MO25-like protein At2g03410 [Camelina sativa]|uniref:MO25-like protein At2g03410 n=1 Tax=Camelina sativa TaxID=90675 RepID=A0ABM0TSQ9_CAMSA|nr:PREDICTED: MO25-like protein At2g03410 [Camelina sativa]